VQCTGRFGAVEAGAVPEQDVLWLEAAERSSRREEAEQWVDAERLVARPEVAEAPERICADENLLVSEPDRNLAPEPTPDDRHDDERCAGDVRERRLVVRDAEARCNRGAVPSVAVEELDDGSGLAECGDPVVETGAVHDVGQPDAASADDGVCGSRELVVIANPVEAVLELVEMELHGETMPVANDISNTEVADRLESFGALLDLSGAQPYASRAYRRAAEMIRETKAPIADLVRAGRVRELRGIGPGIEARLRELVQTGRIAELDELEHEVAPELVGLGRLLGFGPKRATEIARALDVRTVDEFRAAAAEGRLATVPGIGPKTEAKFLAALATQERPRPRRGMLLNRARALLEGIAQALGGEIAGDPRRWRDVNEEFAVVCAGSDPGPVLGHFERLVQIVAIVERSDRRAIGVTVEGVPVELVVAEPERFGTELLRATGSVAYVDSLEPLPDAPDEEGVYAALGIPFCPPELREEPFRAEPPPLVGLEDIRGDLHVHTDWSDGKASVLEMGEAALALGYEYLAICDHTRNVRVVPGLDADDVRRQGEEIAEANELLARFRILRGIECDILPDGSLDLPDDVLAELEWVQASVHAGQRASAADLTKRTVEAMRHPAVRCLSHPKGRIINHRPENALDLERVFEVALETEVAVEINGLAPRLDLRDVHVRAAIEAGVPIVCSTDAHSVRGLGNMQLSVATARRGWATAANILNTRPLAEILGL
jgi:DNA polymerase (family X)